MARTTSLYPTTYAGPGAVRQSGGSLQVYSCNECGGEVVWATSRRTGKKYLANVSRGHNDQRFYIAANLHREPERAKSPALVAAEMLAQGSHPALEALIDQMDDEAESEYDEAAADAYELTMAAERLPRTAAEYAASRLSGAAEDIYWSNLFAEQERAQEAAAFMAGSRRW